jgi:carbamate kinase
MKKKIVVTLGHRALGRTLPEQAAAVKQAVKSVADLVAEGANVAITHSNGTQVGMIHTAMNEFALKHSDYTGAPMSVCSAMSQGYIGYDLQNALRTELLRRGIYRPVVTLITQVTVDPYDDALYRPSKVIGRVMTKEEAEAEEEKGNYVTEVEGGYRRMIAAPRPKEIVEIESIQLLVDAGQIVIAGGGGGIPVMEQGEALRGAGAVIEKDMIGERMAELLHADELYMLTSVENAKIGYNTDSPKPLGKITVEQAKVYIEDGQFEPGTMLPKIEAAVNFIEKGGSRAIITSIEKARDAYLGRCGTIIEAEKEEE